MIDAQAIPVYRFQPGGVSPAGTEIWFWELPILLMQQQVNRSRFSVYPSLGESGVWSVLGRNGLMYQHVSTDTLMMWRFIGAKVLAGERLLLGERML